MDKFVISKVMSPLHFPEKTKFIAGGTEILATPVSLIDVLTVNRLE